jgi:hypothetical protein
VTLFPVCPVIVWAKPCSGFALSLKISNPLMNEKLYVSYSEFTAFTSIVN